MFEHILVAIDGSEQAQSGCTFALHLAGRVGGKVTIVEIIEPAYDLWVSVPEPVPALDRVQRDHEKASTERLASLAAGATAGVAVETKVVHGRPAATILDMLGELAPDLAVAGTHGVGFGRFLLGSVSQRLLEQSPCDLLLFREQVATDRPLNVIAALDESEHARQALGVATRLASALSACLVLTHVADEHIPSAPLDNYSGLREAIRDHGARLLSAAHQRVAPVEAVVEDLREGAATPGLIAACNEYAPAIAVVGSRGARGFHGLLVGSTARDLVNYAPCPVLAVRPSTRFE